MISIAVDAQGSEVARPYLEKAGTTFVSLIDQTNLLSELLGFKAVPNGLLIDELGILNYRKYGGFEIRNAEYRGIVASWLEGASPEWLLNRMQEDPMGGIEHQKAILHFRTGVDYLNEGNVMEALAEWKLGRDIEPDNWVIRKQIWALENPDKFYNEEVDYAWQELQIRKGL